MKIFLTLFLLIPIHLWSDECIETDQASINYCFGKQMEENKLDRDKQFELFLSQFDKQIFDEGLQLRNLAWDYFGQSALNEYIFDSYSLKNVEIMSIKNDLDNDFVNFFITKEYDLVDLNNVSDEEINIKFDQIKQFMNNNFMETEWENELYKYVENQYSYPIFEKQILDIQEKFLEYRVAYSEFFIKIKPDIKIIDISNHLNKNRLKILENILYEMDSGK